MIEIKLRLTNRVTMRKNDYKNMHISNSQIVQFILIISSVSSRPLSITPFGHFKLTKSSLIDNDL